MEITITVTTTTSKWCSRKLYSFNLKIYKANVVLVLHVRVPLMTGRTHINEVGRASPPGIRIRFGERPHRFHNLPSLCATEFSGHSSQQEAYVQQGKAQNNAQRIAMDYVHSCDCIGSWSGSGEKSMKKDAGWIMIYLKRSRDYQVRAKHR